MDYSGKIITKNPVEPSQTSAPGVWTLDQATQAVQGNNWPIAYVPNPISRSLRFNSADSAYLSWTPASAGNRKTWTWSGWVKRSALTTGSIQGLFAGVDSSNAQIVTGFRFRADDALELISYNAGYTSQLITSQVFRDVSSWYHLVAVYDTTQATSTNRVKIYVNGSQVTSFSTATYPSQNYDAFVNTNGLHVVGAAIFGSVIEHLAGYLTEVNFIDGQALDPTYFGMTDPRTGAWISKKYSGTYGTNGFYLNFSDNSSTAALGTDYSGNNNTWTTNNFSVTAGSGNDSMTDVPTPWIPYNTTGDIGGVVRGNYCTLNPLKNSMSMSNGNLYASCTTTAWQTATSTVGVSSGKWYFEGTPSSQTYVAIGVCDSAHSTASTYFQSTTSWIYNGDAFTDGNGINGVSYGATYGNGDVIGVALDMDAGTLVFYKNGVSQGTAFNTGLSGKTLFPIVAAYNNGVNWFANFGQRPFAYTPPAGFKSLCTTNLPEPTVLDGGDYFNAVLWTGTDNAARTITGVGFQPDWVWAKRRSGAANHYLWDAVRGTNLQLFSNLTNAEANMSTSDNGGIGTAASDGFNIISGTVDAQGLNATSATFVAWNWKANGAGSSNTAGTITSTVSANQTAGFSIVSWTANGSANQSIGHGLGATPSMIITKNRDGVYSWATWFKGFSADEYILLNTTDAKLSYSSIWYQTPTSSVFYVGSTATGINHGTDKNIAYCFAPIAGFSAFGSYTGNGSSDGPFIYLGFRPRYWLVKKTSDIDVWAIHDTARDPYNVSARFLQAESSAAESTGAGGAYFDLLSNGVKIRTTSNQVNTSGGTYIYIAFAENPFKYSNAR